jgi:hypothetical protein
VVERILDWVGGGAEIPALMDGFLTEFITAACGLDLSTVLRDYTLQLVTRYLSWLPLDRYQAPIFQLVIRCCMCFSLSPGISAGYHLPGSV